MRRSRLLKLLFTVLTAVLLLCAGVLAQDDNEREDEEDPTSRNLRRSVALFLMRGVDEDMDYIYNNRKLFDLGPLRVDFKSLPLGSRLEIELPKNPVFRFLGFSTVLPNPYAGSPAYDIINTWRNSLNIDVITGKYYWEW